MPSLSGKVRQVTRYLELRRRASGRRPLASAELKEDLYIALEELRITAEELEHQSHALQAARQRYLELFELGPDADLVTDPAGVIVEVNQAASVLLGAGRRSLEGKPLAVFVAETDRAAFYAKLRQLCEPGAQAVRGWELGVLPRGGAPVPVSATVGVALDQQDRPIGLRFLLREISDRKRDE